MPARNVSLKANYTKITDINSVESALIKIYPNHAMNVLNITGLNSSTVVNIFNSAGVRLKIKTGAEINVKELPKGTYIVSIVTPQGIFNKRFVKE